ncbi:hypothetical protein M4D76_24510 [Peribacillus frigoritolerans]|nr:hypothetical protein [Peribacillus frigoritolerans]MCT1391429.1 hypothetical protein [Peribacillus frigoritolerans]
MEKPIEPIGVRVTKSEKIAIVGYAKKKRISQSEAIRELISIGLSKV